MFVDLIRKILAPEAGVRERAAEEIVDRLGLYTPAQVSALVALLSSTAVVEKVYSALESELHAILELTSTGHVTLDHVAPLREMQLEELPNEIKEYVIDLLEG
ncbi:hypothetical protein ACFYZ8_40275 [Streptomyces sp. NPDC001668]|uniref:hypothetical protein n=1 Tax=unclassified Streptomyces TaxID=2593676 RepID=UPI0036BAFB9E